MSEADIELEVVVHPSTYRRIGAGCQASSQGPDARDYRTIKNMHSRERFYGNRKHVDMFKVTVINTHYL